MFTYHKTCRACGNTDLKTVFDFGKPMPLANAFSTPDGPQKGFVPIAVLFCEKCTLAQLGTVVDPAVLYENYCYETSKSETMRQHFVALWEAIKAQGNADSVIEVGSNDGDMLQFACENGADHVCGIDAAENLASKAIRNGVPTVIGILDDNTAKCASRVVPKADVIVARHVFCHANDWKKFICNLDAMANKDTLVAIEVPYAVDTLERCEWDQIYHEHTSYLSIRAMDALLEETNFRIQKVIRFPVHGGSIVIFLRWKYHECPPDASVAEFLKSERITLRTWELFEAKALWRMDKLKYELMALIREGKRVVGYGASAKSTVWISACGFTRKQITFIVDNTPHKQGKCSPGTDIPIVPESELTNAKADVAICFAWNFMREIEEKNMEWVKGGGRFINPHAL